MNKFNYIAICVFVALMTDAVPHWPRHPDDEALSWPDDVRTWPESRQTCPYYNAGCIFDDNFHAGRTDCSTNGNKACSAVGADYCGGWYGFPPRRTCCEITDVLKEKSDADSRGCPPANSGCVFDDFATATECTIGGNTECRLAGSHYCGAFYGSPPTRMCCAITHTVNNNPEQVNKHNGCPATKSGCIYDDEVEGSDCFADGNSACAAVGADYCSAWYGLPPRRSCCRISGPRTNERPAAARYSCPKSHHGCIFDDFVHGAECTSSGNAGCKVLGADYCGAYYGFPPKRLCCNVSGAAPPRALRQLVASRLPGRLVIPGE